MKTETASYQTVHHPLEPYQPKPNELYSLEVAAHLAGIPRRSLLVYCRIGMVRPVSQPPYGVMAFTEEAIHAARRIERVKAVHCPDLALLKFTFDLLEEVERLKLEVRFLRRH
jgi:predicted site-specific integrase-resolvase